MISLKKTFLAACLAVVGLSTSVKATPLGDLTDGLLHIGSVTGEWSLYANAGDVITITARRLDPVDIWSYATYGATHMNPNSGDPSVVSPTYGVGWGDDQLAPFVGGSFGDPQYTFTSAYTGLITVWVSDCCNDNQITARNYNVIASGSTASAVPEAGASLVLVGLGLASLGLMRWKQKAA